MKLTLIVLLGAALISGAASAQNPPSYPDRPVRFVIPYPPAGTSDNLGRLIAEKLRSALGQPMVVENKPGGTSSVGAELVAQAKPDGYTLLLGPMTAFSVLPHLRKLPYDPIESFEPVAMVAQYLAIITVRNDLPVRNFTELVAHARKFPGKLTYGSAGVASFGNMAGESIKLREKIDILHVPFKGSGDLVPALLGGQIDLFIDGVGLSLAKSGKARPIAIFGDLRHPDLPDVPALTEVVGAKTELPTTWWGVFAPKGTPAPALKRLEAELARILADPETKERMHRISVVPYYRPSAEMRKVMKQDSDVNAELIRSTGMRLE
jgi:tripartite-type tricarboxylate transporter receptor subunit TctC